MIFLDSIGSLPYLFPSVPAILLTLGCSIVTNLGTIRVCKVIVGPRFTQGVIADVDLKEVVAHLLIEQNL